VTDDLPMEKAKAMGAMSLFGEKYGDTVRVVGFGGSVELCGGTHVSNTGSIGLVKIISEAAIAAGVRRIEAVTGARAEEYINERLILLNEVSSLLKSTGNVRDSVEKLLAENSSLKRSLEKFQALAVKTMIKALEGKAVQINDITFLSDHFDNQTADILKNVAFGIRSKADNAVLAIGSEIGGKAHLLVMVNDKLVKERNLNAVSIIKEIAGEIKGGGGGQPFLATAGGNDPGGIDRALGRIKEYLQQL